MARQVGLLVAAGLDYQALSESWQMFEPLSPVFTCLSLAPEVGGAIRTAAVACGSCGE
jgi:hypothetical protein